MHQPSDSEPHDDHMHVRVYCEREDRSAGCLDRGPVRWWKKRWKFMSPPFARDSDGPDELIDLVRSRVAPTDLSFGLTS